MGEVVLVDAAGAAQLVVPPGVAWDARAASDTPVEGESGAAEAGRAPVSVSVAPRPRSQGGWLLTVAVDPAWLASPRRVFPVSVDPTVSTAANGSYSYRSDGYSCTNCQLRMGNIRPVGGGDSYYRTVFKLPYENLLGKQILTRRSS